MKKQQPKQTSEKKSKAVILSEEVPQKQSYRTFVVDTRCSLGHLAALCNELSEPQKNDIIEMGLGSLLHLPSLNLNRNILLSLTKSYDFVSNELVTPAGRIPLSWREIGYLFNIPYSGIPLSNISVRKDQRDLILPFLNKTVTQVRQMVLDNPTGVMFRRAFLLFASLVFLFPTQSLTATPTTFPLLLDVENFGKYNWSRHIMEFLIEGNRRFTEGRIRYWMCFHLSDFVFPLAVFWEI